jgi:hypothetical protein
MKVTPAQLPKRLAKARERMAEVAYYCGGDDDYWSLWLALVDAMGESHEDAITGLSYDQAYWLARWSFDHERRALGLAVYEHHLKHTGEPTNKVSNNYFSNFVYFAEALVAKEPGRALDAFRPVREQFGCEASDEVLFATLSLLQGELDEDGLRKVIERFRRSSNQVVQAARLIALDTLDDAAGVRQAFGLINSGFSKFTRRVMVERFGDAFMEALERPPPPLKKRKRIAGLIATRGKRKSGHLFAPDAQAGPPCPGCGHPLRIWFTLDLTKVKVLKKRLPSWKRFDVPACFDCNTWMLQHEYLVDDAGQIELREVEQATKDLAEVFSDDSTRPIGAQVVRLVKAPKDLDELPLDGHCQIGGNPAWIQDEVDVLCPDCEQEMVFVFRFSAPNDFEGSPMVAGESGALYYFACPTCTRFTQLAQWT